MGKLIKFLMFMVVLIALISLWIWINKEGGINLMTKIVRDVDIADKIFNYGLGALIVITFISTIAYLLNLMGLKLFRFM